MYIIHVSIMGTLTRGHNKRKVDPGSEEVLLESRVYASAIIIIDGTRFVLRSFECKNPPLQKCWNLFFERLRWKIYFTLNR